MIHTGRTPAGHAALADLLRQQITSGRLAPGAAVPSDRYLRETYGVGRNTVKAAIQLLCHEGLIVRGQGRISRVRHIHDKRPLDLSGAVRVDVRMPSPREREDMRERTELGVPVWVVTYSDGTVRLFSGDRWTIPGPLWPGGAS